MESVEEKVDLKALFNAKDDVGNVIFLNERNSVVYRPVSGRAIGLGIITLDDKNRIICTKEEDEAQIFRKDNSWSINKLLLDRVDAVIYNTKIKKYSISRTRALSNGTLRTYNGEEKCYVPLDLWKQTYNSTLMETRINLMGEDWVRRLSNQLDSDYFKELSRFIATERKTKVIYPEKEDIFKALKLCTYDDFRVCILGQDPYFNGVADGLAFSAKSSLRMPASLGIIRKELEAHDNKPRISGNDLTDWAKQGVMLLNTILTVEHDKPRSHAGKGWETFTTFLISVLNQHPKPCVFILWGKDAQEYKKMIDTRYHFVLEGAHPASVARCYGGFLGGDYFNKTNEFLRLNGREEIKW